MLCERCQERQATVLITRVLNGQKKEVRLCESCAQQQNSMSIQISPKEVLQNFFADFFNSQYPGLSSNLITHNDSIKCEVCGFADTHFPKVGKLGCSKCYVTFEHKIDPLLRKIHGTVRHTGKIPQRTRGDLKLRQEVGHLRIKLQQAIGDEDYETAAQLRDTIRDKEKQLKEGHSDGN